MNKKGFLILIIFILFSITFGIGRYFLEKYKNDKFEVDEIENYGFEISYPRAYKKVESEMENINENVLIQSSGENVSEYMENLNLVEKVRELKNKKNGIRLIIEAINKEKTELSIEEICKRYVAMFKVYNEDKTIRESNSEPLLLNETEIGKVNIIVKGEIEDSSVVTYLMPLEDREITVTFIAPQKIMESNKTEIEKIIDSIKIVK